MSVYTPNSRPEDKWGHWEDPDYIRVRYHLEGEQALDAHQQIQKLLIDAGFIGIDNASGGSGTWNYGVWVVSREHEFDLSKSWYEDGELFGEYADREYETWNLWGTGKDTQEAAIDLLRVVKDFVENGPLGSQIMAAEAAIENQRRKVKREQDTLGGLTIALDKLLEQKQANDQHN
jgi:hypothetical protein